MDYLPIQASSVPCKRIFSLSVETNTKQRNHISPLMMKFLQMIKTQFKSEHLNSMAGWETLEKQMVNDDLKEDLLHQILQVNFQDSLNSIIQNINVYKDQV